MSQKQHVIHGRDHEHGGADPTRIAWEDVGGGGTSGGGGIQFDTYPQAGEWLYVQTNGPGMSPSGYGFELYDPSGGGIDLSADSGGNILQSTTGGGRIILQSTGGVQLHDNSSYGINLQALMNGVFLAGPTATLEATGASASPVTLSETELTLTLEDGVFTLSSSTGPILVVDAMTGGVPAYRIRTGGLWAADL